MSAPKVLEELTRGIPLDPLPPAPSPERDSSVPHAPIRRPGLTDEEFKLAVRNALRYFPESFHEILAPEFVQELRDYGHIYMYRFRPTYVMHARPIEEYPGKCVQARAIMMMIQNNLDPKVAQFPHELVTYGGNGSVLNNWAQYHLVMYYLSQMTQEQTLAMYSGHPMGLFPSHPDAPRVVIANGMMVSNYSTKAEYDRLYALGGTIYGQMTAGSYCYIGPQGIVHGTTLTLLNAGRKYLNLDSLRGKVFISSGLGGMSGAQPKASVITGAIGVVAEVNRDALEKRYRQGWVHEIISDVEKLVERLREAREKKEVTSIAFHGNVVSVWERLAEEKDLLVELGSDQTSLHDPFGGGYYPVTLTVEEANEMMVKDPEGFKEHVNESLRRQAAAINKLTGAGMKFWDYGNSFLLQASRAGADVMNPSGTGFKYPSYVEDIMGDIFSLGFGPFRWVCSSNDPEDLAMTDKIAGDVIEELAAKAESDDDKRQYADNLLWIRQADENKLVVGSQARILYSNAEGRVAIALAFNRAVRAGILKAPVVISRDHHDTSGADSPWRETSNIRDGSMFTADMSFHTVCGNSFRGATWVAYHNGGGTGWGEAMNCGFGMVLDGTEATDLRAKRMLWWDVNNGVARRAWSRHPLAEATIKHSMSVDPLLRITLPAHADDELLDRAISELKKRKTSD
eukprot:TRINITY_DN80450_c0_g1_i1.p1 TRINITY_DN80450_c0_g1~~TRINITY_DN80450_c0_g1_i1.p1  ORF type:complete len:683 (-),score=184.62 TRINITY_DN80450_c0_g1_i1:189-2237(-)